MKAVITKVKALSMKLRMGSPKLRKSQATKKERGRRALRRGNGKYAEIEVDALAGDGDDLVGDRRRPFD